MLHAKAFANAATTIIAAFYITCLVLSFAAPDVLFGIANSWIHSLNLEALQTKRTITIDSAIWGLITISALTWMSTYATIILYNRWSKKG